MVTNEFGRLLRELRQARQMTIEQLAEVSGVSVRGISDMELGHSKSPRRGTITALTQGMDLSEDEVARLLGALASELWFERAARLATDTRARVDALLTAGELALGLDRQDEVQRCVGELLTLPLDPPERLRLLWLQAAFDDGNPGSEDDLRRLIDTADRVHHDGATDLAALLLMSAARRYSYLAHGDGRCAETAKDIVLATKRLGLYPGDPRVTNVQALAGPFQHAREAIGTLEVWTQHEVTDPEIASLLAYTAFSLADFEKAAWFCDQALSEHDRPIKRNVLAQLQNLRAWSAFYLGQFDIAEPLCAQSFDLAPEQWQPAWCRWVQICQAILAALRGDAARAHALLQEIAPQVAASAVVSLRCGFELACALADMADGDGSGAYAHMLQIMQDSGHAASPVLRGHQVDIFADAALLAGQTDQARTVLAQLEAADAFVPSSGVACSLAYAHAVLAPDDTAPQLIARAGELAGSNGWFTARLQLAHGQLLQRQGHLQAAGQAMAGALHTFQALGTRHWAARAEQYLHALHALHA